MLNMTWRTHYRKFANKAMSYYLRILQATIPMSSAFAYKKRCQKTKIKGLRKLSRYVSLTVVLEDCWFFTGELRSSICGSSTILEGLRECTICVDTLCVWWRPLLKGWSSFLGGTWGAAFIFWLLTSWFKPFFGVA